MMLKLPIYYALIIAFHLDIFYHLNDMRCTLQHINKAVVFRVYTTKGIMSLSLVKSYFFKLFFFALKVNIYLQNMSIKRVFSLFFVCNLSPSVINYVYPNFRTTCAMTLIFILQHEFELSTLSSIPSNGGLC
jgi:hypothetical protein